LHFANCALWLHTAAIRFDLDTAPGAASSYPAHSASDIRSDRPDGGYDAGVQPPPPGPPPQWGPPPEDPREHAGYGDYGQPPPPPGYGPPQWGGYGPPAPPPTSQQTFGWISLAAIGLLGLLGAILTLTLWINLNSSVSRATDVCKRFGGEYANMCLIAGLVIAVTGGLMFVPAFRVLLGLPPHLTGSPRPGGYPGGGPWPPGPPPPPQYGPPGPPQQW